ncbi:MAG: hypothetical protein DWH79_08150 [Planctomycetota bacterium]|nr:MAG: hypothetical protein DWH79_08150 [Planctomycetota bacterium]
MFVPQHAARRRTVRALFLAVCVAPCAVLAAWAGWWHSSGHRDSLRREWEAVLGVPLEIGRIDHVRPGTIRLSDLVIRDTAGEARLAVESLEIESAAGEIRIRVPSFFCTPEGAGLCAQLAGDWLAQPQRFASDCIVDINSLTLLAGGQPGDPPVGDGLSGAAGIVPRGSTPAGGIRAECVAADGTRAIRLRTEPESGDELRVLFRAAGGPDRMPPGFEVSGEWSNPVPLAVVAKVLEWPVIATAGGDGAALRARIDCRHAADGWSGMMAGEITAFDLARCTAGMPVKASGTARLTIRRLDLLGGRLAGCRAEIAVDKGSLSQATVESLVTLLGCRPGPAWRVLSPAAACGFDRLACGIEVGAAGLRITPLTEFGGAILVSDGAPLLSAPVTAIPIDRIAWLLSPGGGPAVPATALTGWLLSVLPMPLPGADGMSGDLQTTQAPGPVEAGRTPKR